MAVCSKRRIPLKIHDQLPGVGNATTPRQCLLFVHAARSRSPCRPYPISGIVIEQLLPAHSPAANRLRGHGLHPQRDAETALRCFLPDR